MSASWVAADATPSVSTMVLTYWCRLLSVDFFQAGLVPSVIDLPARYDVIWYGPSESVCVSSWLLFGTYASYSTGLAEVNGIAMM